MASMMEKIGEKLHIGGNKKENEQQKLHGTTGTTPYGGTHGTTGTVGHDTTPYGGTHGTTPYGGTAGHDSTPFGGTTGHAPGHAGATGAHTSHPVAGQPPKEGLMDKIKKKTKQHKEKKPGHKSGSSSSDSD